ncbi:low affinity iron permease family protein [Caballeronia sp. 15715]|uniref:low affinity iron permease family protein n=1 Tax=unclassified Caballeronia TaxID=2646786 RepID=UPI0039E5D115
MRHNDSSTDKLSTASDTCTPTYAAGNPITRAFGRFASAVTRWVGSPIAFALAATSVVVWGITGPIYIERNAGTLVNYGTRYHKGLPISSSIAESAVNLVVSHRMAKKQQMRWTDEGAHCLAQVRVAVLNEEFSVEKLAVLTKTSAAENSPSARRAA